MKPCVRLQGGGQDVTIITSDASSGGWSPTQATPMLASDVSLRDLSVHNTGEGIAAEDLPHPSNVCCSQSLFRSGHFGLF